MKGYFRKVNGALVPDDEETQNQFKKLKTGDAVYVDYSRPRNMKFHRKFFALVNLVYQNQERYESKESVLTEIKLQVGHYEEHITIGGKITYQPKSISFAKMDEDAFSIFYNSVVDVVLKRFLVGMSRDELDEMVDAVLGFA